MSESFGLVPRDPRKKDSAYGAGYNLECPHCGRLYDGEESPSLKAGDACPDDDCPTHWELIGKAFPNA